LSATSAAPFVGRIRDRRDFAAKTEIFLSRQPEGDVPAGFRAYLLACSTPNAEQPDTYVLPPRFEYLADGDVVRVDPVRRALTVLYRSGSKHNSFLVTERCDNYCVMCSQPPKELDDSWLVSELSEVIPLVSPDTREIALTGGEPALLGERLTRLVALAKAALPRTALHILSNGRRFSDVALAQGIADVGHPDLMIGIPLYSDLAEDHDYVVQARGAFDETVRGILNLKRRGVRVELRFVIHRDTYERLPAFAEFIARNFLFVDHVALMGLEPTGFAKTNLNALWIDPMDYRPQLSAATRTLARGGLRVSIYNHQLCVLPAELHRFARRSISDWKNTYFDDCDPCGRKDECAGFFASSAIRKSTGIAPFV
jgi:His-Xaa-Ser system radical SAM maturase HxsC